MKPVSGFGLLILFSFVGLGGVSNGGWAQEANANLPDSPSVAADRADPPPGQGREPFNPSVERETTWRTLPGNFLHDQKNIWLFPTKLARGKYWVPTLAVAGVTAGLIFADPHVMPYFRGDQRNLDDFNDMFDAYSTTG